MWRHRCAGGLKKKLYLRSGSQRQIHFAGFFNVPVLHRHGTNFFKRRFRHTRPFSRLLRHAGDTEDVFSTYTPGVLTGALQNKSVMQLSITKKKSKCLLSCVNVLRVHRLILCLKYMIFPLVLSPSPLLRQRIAILRSPKGGCCSISDDSSCSHISVLMIYHRASEDSWSYAPPSSTERRLL